MDDAHFGRETIQALNSHAAELRRSGRQPLCRLNFKGTLNRQIVEEKFYCVLPNHQMWSKDPNCREMDLIFLKNDGLFRTFNYSLTLWIGK